MRSAHLLDAPLIAHKAKWWRCMNSTAADVGKILPAGFILLQRAFMATNLALLRVGSLICSAIQTLTGYRFAITLTLSAFPQLPRYYPVAKNLIDIAFQPDCE